jgi:hypothetical protein
MRLYFQKQTPSLSVAMRPRQENIENRMKKIRTLVLLVSIALPAALSGCGPPTLRSYRNTGLGQPVDLFRQLDKNEGSYASRSGWKENTHNLENGNWVYVEPFKPNCFIHWEVNPEGIIVGSHAEGKGCDMWPFR